MTNDKSGIWGIGENSGANAMADENPMNDYEIRSIYYFRDFLATRRSWSS